MQLPYPVEEIYIENKDDEIGGTFGVKVRRNDLPELLGFITSNKMEVTDVDPKRDIYVRVDGEFRTSRDASVFTETVRQSPDFNED